MTGILFLFQTFIIPWETLCVRKGFLLKEVGYGRNDYIFSQKYKVLEFFFSSLCFKNHVKLRITDNFSRIIKINII